MDSQILEWVSQHPRDWWRSTKSNVFTWGKGSWNQLGHSTRERTLPAQAEEWQDAQQASGFVTSLCMYSLYQIYRLA